MKWRKNKDWCVGGGVSLLCPSWALPNNREGRVVHAMQVATLPETTTAGGRRVLLARATAMPSPLHITSLSRDQSDPRRQIVRETRGRGLFSLLSFSFLLAGSESLLVRWRNNSMTCVYCCDRQTIARWGTAPTCVLMRATNCINVCGVYLFAE